MTTDSNSTTKLVCRYCRSIEDDEIELWPGECLCKRCYQEALFEHGYANEETNDA